VALAPASTTSFSWAAERMRDVTCQPRERRSGVKRRETLPWPPRRRIWGEGDVSAVDELDMVWRGTGG
jgi:hypothetical protein